MQPSNAKLCLKLFSILLIAPHPRSGRIQHTIENRVTGDGDFMPTIGGSHVSG
jgi:hypothetical protein